MARKGFAIVLLLCAVACGREGTVSAPPETAETVLKNYLDNLYRGSVRMAYDMATKADRAAMSFEEFEKSANFAQAFTAQATYSIKNVDVQGSTAKAAVDVTMPDYSGGALAILGAAMSQDKEAAKKAVAQMKDAPKKTHTENFTLRLEPEGWRIDAGWAEKKRKEDEAKAAQRAYYPKLQITDIEVKDGFMGPYLSGELKNTGDKILKHVQLKVYLLDSAGKPIAEETFVPVTASFEPNPLKPGYVEKLSHTIRKAPKEWAKKVRVEIESIEFGP